MKENLFRQGEVCAVRQWEVCMFGHGEVCMVGRGEVCRLVRLVSWLVRTQHGMDYKTM